MKTLKNFLIESKTLAVFDDVIELAYTFIDYMYNEGVVTYDDKHLSDIFNRKNKPDYVDVCNGILAELNVTKQTQTELENYVKTQKGNQIENAINAAFDKFCNDANID